MRPDDRLGMALFLAVVVHALLILGVGLTWEGEERPSETSMMEVTLAYDEAETPPEEADYLADLDQDGGGVAEQAQIPSPLAGEPTPATEAPEPGEPAATPEARAEALIESEQAETPTPPTDDETQAEERPSLQDLLDSRREAAAAEAVALQQRLSQPREPSKRFLNARTRSHEAAAYMEAWTRKVEAVGNLNYPSEARERGLSGRLILEVTLMPDGSLEDVRIVQRSRHRLLDEAAVRIVRLGAPYPDIPEEVLEGQDRLVITRTWEFVEGRRVRAQ
ncbi:TonB family protein [Halorhodospira halophila]|uniref:TonB family protein n=1 Tax=Halorhodospira halophila TaxID=1053 RepID=UPI0002EE3569